MEWDQNRILKFPKVYVMSRQVIDEKGLSNFLTEEGLEYKTDAPGPAEKLAEIAGKVCYMSYGKGRKNNQQYLENIMESKHGSVLEHTVWSLMFCGVSRSLTHELIRHRAGMAYSQLSQRYVDESDAKYVIPPLFQESKELSQKWETTVKNAQKAYEELVEMGSEYVKEKHPEVAGTDRRKFVRQSARAVLPNSCETKILVTANARAWRHFLEMRGSMHAAAEIRNLALEVARILKKEAPNIFGDIEIKEEKGIRYLDIKYSKV